MKVQDDMAFCEVYIKIQNFDRKIAEVKLDLDKIGEMWTLKWYEIEKTQSFALGFV